MKVGPTYTVFVALLEIVDPDVECIFVLKIKKHSAAMLTLRLDGLFPIS